MNIKEYQAGLGPQSRSLYTHMLIAIFTLGDESYELHL
jgi:hypothetical protein